MRTVRLTEIRVRSISGTSKIQPAVQPMYATRTDHHVRCARMHLKTTTVVGALTVKFVVSAVRLVHLLLLVRRPVGRINRVVLLCNAPSHLIVPAVSISLKLAVDGVRPAVCVNMVRVLDRTRVHVQDRNGTSTQISVNRRYSATNNCHMSINK